MITRAQYQILKRFDATPRIDLDDLNPYHRATLYQLGLIDRERVGKFGKIRRTTKGSMAVREWERR